MEAARIRRVKSKDRAHALANFRGKLVEVTVVDPAGRRTYRGLLVAAGALHSGTVIDFIALRGEEVDHAWSGAVIDEIRTIGKED